MTRNQSCTLTLAYCFSAFSLPFVLAHDLCQLSEGPIYLYLKSVYLSRGVSAHSFPGTAERLARYASEVSAEDREGDEKINHDESHDTIDGNLPRHDRWELASASTTA